MTTGPNFPPPRRVGGLRLLRLVVLGNLLASVVLAALVVTVFLANQGAHDGLCALRADLERRVASQQNFLREHPDGIPGIPASTIRTGISNQQRTIRALSDISCDQ